jgi:hypothetical protein
METPSDVGGQVGHVNALLTREQEVDMRQGRRDGARGGNDGAVKLLRVPMQLLDVSRGRRKLKKKVKTKRKFCRSKNEQKDPPIHHDTSSIEGGLKSLASRVVSMRPSGTLRNQVPKCFERCAPGENRTLRVNQSRQGNKH